MGSGTSQQVRSSRSMPKGVFVREPRDSFSARHLKREKQKQREREGERDTETGGEVGANKEERKEKTDTSPPYFACPLRIPIWPVKELGKHVILKETIGEGNYGKVHLVESRSDHTTMIAKAILYKEEEKQEAERERTKKNERKGRTDHDPLQTFPSQRTEPLPLSSPSLWISDAVRNEVRNALRASHPNVVQLRAAYAEEKGCVLILDHCKGGDLYRAVVSRALTEKHTLSLRQLTHLAVDMLSALCVLYAQRIAHRDIKPENIFLSSSNVDETQFILGDFGFACRDRASEPLHTFCGSPMYMAPEIIRCRYGLYHEHSPPLPHGDVAPATGEARSRTTPSPVPFPHCRMCVFERGGRLDHVPKEERKPYTVACDVWSLGTVLFECWYGVHPFRAKGSTQTLLNVLDGRVWYPDVKEDRVQFLLHDRCRVERMRHATLCIPPMLKEVLRQMLVYDPAKRAHPAALLNMPWFQQPMFMDYTQHKRNELQSVLRQCRHHCFPPHLDTVCEELHLELDS
mmetsp:Transcript_29150/g.74939  ORF Transcript_29150/g.74939 Transcript_29150/m.74939 type:complete len:517 (-) Transcript_29150:389-1939(-)